MSDLPPDVIVECRIVNGEPEVFLSIEGTTFHLHPDDAQVIGGWLVEKSGAAQALLSEHDTDSAEAEDGDGLSPPQAGKP